VGNGFSRTGIARPRQDSHVRLTARQLNRATLARQLLLAREPLPVPEAVRRVVAIQAQHSASPYVALWNRLAPFDPADLDDAFAAAAVVKASLMRVTLHAVHAEDHRVLHTALQPTLRGSRLADRRFTGSGLSAAEMDALVPDLLEHAREPRTNRELEAWVDAHVDGRVDGSGAGVWWALRCYAPLRHAPTGGPWSFGPRPSYLAVDDAPDPGRATPPGPTTPDDALPVLIRRYLEGFGPASVADVAQFAGAARTRVRAAVAAMSRDLVEHEGPDGATVYDVRGGWVPAEDTPAPPRLMAMWDSVLLAYADRSRVIPPGYRRLVIGSNGDVLPTVLVDGYVAGVWRPVDDGIEVTAFHALGHDTWSALAAEARSLVALLRDREPRVYRRYDRWWTGLPAAEVRVLPGSTTGVSRLTPSAG
jgi:hypothetical protein